MADSIIDLIALERQGSRIIADFSNEADAIWIERMYRAARPAFDFRLTTVDVEEGRKGAGVADVLADGIDISSLVFEVSDDRFKVHRAPDGKHDLMLADDVALSHAETPTLPLTITATAEDGRSVSHEYVIEVLPSEPETEPADIPGTLIYCPRIDPSEDVKHNLMRGEFGSVYEGGWGYKDAIEIIDDGDGPFLRTHMEKGSHAGTKDKMRGAGFDTRTMKVKHAVLEYKLRFKPGFDPVKGGKLPGLMGGDSPSGHKSADNGFTARLMWRSDAQGELYLYYPDMKQSHGDSIGRGNFHFDCSGKWHTIRQEVKLNDVGQANGFVRAWCNGVPVIEATNLRLRTKDSVLIEGMMHTIFFGGSDDSWGATRDEYVDTGDFKIYA